MSRSLRTCLIAAKLKTRSTRSSRRARRMKLGPKRANELSEPVLRGVNDPDVAGFVAQEDRQGLAGDEARSPKD